MKTQVLIIGGGATGTGIARDLALRGVQCILAEKKDINAGASGANHGLLHSGVRYVASDPEAARECCEEGDIIKRLAPHCVENTGGLFVALEGDGESYIADFPNWCQKCGIPAKQVDIKDAREMEPALSDKLISAYMVEDASIDPFKLSLENVAHAQEHGTILLRHTKVVAFNRSKSRIQSVKFVNTQTNEEIIVEADHVVNAAGAWAGEVAAMADANINMVFSKGTLLVTNNRITKRVINRLRHASDADILVPGGAVSILGTTSVRIDSLDAFYPTVEEVDFLVVTAAEMVPVLKTTRYIRAYCGVRPLVSLDSTGDDRTVSRGFVLLDHKENGVDNLTTITSGKLTTYRLMAEKTADQVCQRLGVTEPCLTGTMPLPDTIDGKWTEPGVAPKVWMKQNNPDDILLCECEMVHKSAVDHLIASARKQNGISDLNALGMRSRIGKGPCQGSFCSVRIAAHMYDQGKLKDNHGLKNLKNFISERWRGQNPLLLNIPLAQIEIQEAMHCGFFGLELETTS